MKKINEIDVVAFLSFPSLLLYVYDKDKAEEIDLIQNSTINLIMIKGHNNKEKSSKDNSVITFKSFDKKQE